MSDIEAFDLAKFLQVLTVNLQMFHWSTSSYAKHVASGQLVTKLQANTDLFVEVLQGLHEKIVPQPKSIKYNEVDEGNVASYLKGAGQAFNMLIDEFVAGHPQLNVSALLNIRDEILADIDQTLYLFTFN